jgi:hypothetical protein
MTRWLVRLAGLRLGVAVLAGVCALSGAVPAFGQGAEPAPVLSVSDDLAFAEAMFSFPEGRIGLLDRFEAVIEVRADASVRIDGWSVEDALGDEVLVTVVDSQPLERSGEFGSWYGRYEVVVEPLVDGELTIGPLAVVYLIDPDREADPTQLEPTRVRLRSEVLSIAVAGPGGALPSEARPAKPPTRPDEGFAWRVLLIVGASVGVVAPIMAALVLAVRTTTRRVRDEAPERCTEELASLERVVRAAGPSGLAIDGGAVAGEAMRSVRAMLDASLGLRTSAMSGREMLESAALRSVLAADAFDRLRELVEASEAVRFAGAGLDEARAFELVESARRVAIAVRRQRGGPV